MIVLLANRSKERFGKHTMARDPIPGITIDTRAKKGPFGVGAVCINVTVVYFCFALLHICRER